jgi:large subunit ribosomal protein L32
MAEAPFRMAGISKFYADAQNVSSIDHRNSLGMSLRPLTRSPLLRIRRTNTHRYVRLFHLAVEAPISSPFPTIPSLGLSFPAISSILPIFAGLWDSILRAVPKKKTTHAQKRKRQLVGKALQDKKNLTRCDACGDWKLLHTLCESCVKSIQRDWRAREHSNGV